MHVEYVLQFFAVLSYNNNTDLVQANPESVAIEVRILPGLPLLAYILLDSRLYRRSAQWGRGSILLIAEMFIL